MLVGRYSIENRQKPAPCVFSKMMVVLGTVFEYFDFRNAIGNIYRAFIEINYTFSYLLVENTRFPG